MIQVAAHLRGSEEREVGDCPGARRSWSPSSIMIGHGRAWSVVAAVAAAVAVAVAVAAVVAVAVVVVAVVVDPVVTTME